MKSAFLEVNRHPFTPNTQSSYFDEIVYEISLSEDAVLGVVDQIFDFRAHVRRFEALGLRR